MSQLPKNIHTQNFYNKKGPYICWLLLCVVSYTYIYIYIKCKNIRKTQNRNFQSNSCLEWYSMRQFKKYFSQIKCIFIQFVFFFVLFIYSPCFFLFCYFLPDCLTACLLHACRLWIWLIMWIFVLYTCVYVVQCMKNG